MRPLSLLGSFATAFSAIVFNSAALHTEASSTVVACQNGTSCTALRAIWNGCTKSKFDVLTETRIRECLCDMNRGLFPTILQNCLSCVENIEASGFLNSAVSKTAVGFYEDYCSGLGDDEELSLNQLLHSGAQLNRNLNFPIVIPNGTCYERPQVDARALRFSSSAATDMATTVLATSTLTSTSVISPGSSTLDNVLMASYAEGSSAVLYISSSNVALSSSSSTTLSSTTERTNLPILEATASISCSEEAEISSTTFTSTKDSTSTNLVTVNDHTLTTSDTVPTNIANSNLGSIPSSTYKTTSANAATSSPEIGSETSVSAVPSIGSSLTPSENILPILEAASTADALTSSQFTSPLASVAIATVPVVPIPAPSSGTSTSSSAPYTTRTSTLTNILTSIRIHTTTMYVKLNPNYSTVAEHLSMTVSDLTSPAFNANTAICTPFTVFVTITVPNTSSESSTSTLSSSTIGQQGSTSVDAIGDVTVLIPGPTHTSSAMTTTLGEAYSTSVQSSQTALGTLGGGPGAPARNISNATTYAPSPSPFLTPNHPNLPSGAVGGARRLGRHSGITLVLTLIAGFLLLTI